MVKVRAKGVKCPSSDIEDEFNAGVDVLLSSLTSPLRQIAYNAGKEEQWDNLRKKAEQLIHKCEFHLNKKFGSVEAAAQQLSNIVDSGNVHQDLIKTSYKLLLEAIDSLKSSIKEINIDQGKNIRESGADFLAPEQAIEEWEVNIMKALEWISESKEIMENRGQS